jgi:hypothetical protein
LLKTETFQFNAATNYATGKMTKDEALEDFAMQVKSAYPDLEVKP